MSFLQLVTLEDNTFERIKFYSGEYVKRMTDIATPPRQAPPLQAGTPPPGRHPPPVDRQTPVKILPWPKLRFGR